jgi:hypothetical protein
MESSEDFSLNKMLFFSVMKNKVFEMVLLILFSEIFSPNQLSGFALGRSTFHRGIFTLGM